MFIDYEESFVMSKDYSEVIGYTEYEFWLSKTHCGVNIISDNYKETLWSVEYSSLKSIIVQAQRNFRDSWLGGARLIITSIEGDVCNIDFTLKERAIAACSRLFAACDGVWQ